MNTLLFVSMGPLTIAGYVIGLIIVFCLFYFYGKDFYVDPEDNKIFLVLKVLLKTFFITAIFWGIPIAGGMTGDWFLENNFIFKIDTKPYVLFLCLWAVTTILSFCFTLFKNVEEDEDKNFIP